MMRAIVLLTTNYSVDPPVTNRRLTVLLISGNQLLIQTELKYLVLTLGKKLIWKPHITAQKSQIKQKLRQINCVIERKSQLFQNKNLFFNNKQ